MKTTSLKIDYDTNGNKVARFTSVSGRRGFSIQTNGNMPNLHKRLKGDTIAAHDDADGWEEFIAYVSEFGTERQKSFFDI